MMMNTVMLCFIFLFLQQGDQEVGETSPSDLWTSRPLDLSRWYFQKEDKTKLFEGSSVDALIAPPDPSNMKTEFVSIIINSSCYIIFHKSFYKK